MAPNVANMEPCSANSINPFGGKCELLARTGVRAPTLTFSQLGTIKPISVGTEMRLKLIKTARASTKGRSLSSSTDKCWHHIDNGFCERGIVRLIRLQPWSSTRASRGHAFVASICFGDSLITLTNCVPPEFILQHPPFL